MPVRIRLARFGRRHLPHYRITVANSWAKRDGRFIEHIGHYGPIPDRDGNKIVTLKFDRAKYWLGVGAEPTDTVASLFYMAGLLPPKPDLRKGKSEGKDGIDNSNK